MARKLWAYTKWSGITSLASETPPPLPFVMRSFIFDLSPLTNKLSKIIKGGGGGVDVADQTSVGLTTFLL